MSPPPPDRPLPPAVTAGRGGTGLAIAFATLLLACLFLWGSKGLPRPAPLLLAPMIGGLGPCLFHDETPGAASKTAYARDCMAATSAAPLVEATLRQLKPADGHTSRDGRLELGYTLPVPLLRLLKPVGSDWVVDQAAVQRVARTIGEEDRPLILYLFSNHFGTGAPAERALAQDPANLLQTQAGPLPRDSYYGIDVYPWSFVRTDNTIGQLREKIITALLDEICKLPNQTRQRIRGVTLLGELHHMFPKYETGMGYAAPYQVSDYSPTSVAGFRKFLTTRFGTVARLNSRLGSSFADFEVITPPAKDIRTERLTHYWEHIDAYAHGVLPVSGWTFVPGHSAERPAWVRLYRNGELMGRTAVNFSRQDVATAHPEFKTADVGWSFGLDFSAWPPGGYQVDALLEREGGPMVQLASRHIAVMDRTQTTPVPQPMKPLPASVPLAAPIQSYVDAPAELASYYFNPLVPLWHEFRQGQVRAYLAHFREVAARSCLAPQLLYSHQILPGVNPGWDETKFAIGRDLSVPRDLQLGVSLYGEASYGNSFLGQLSTLRRSRYGITEFHPLRPMAAAPLNALFQQHAARGAQFLSFFVDAKGLADSDPKETNFLSFDPRNPKYGSDQLFDAARSALR